MLEAMPFSFERGQQQLSQSGHMSYFSARTFWRARSLNHAHASFSSSRCFRSQVRSYGCEIILKSCSRIFQLFQIFQIVSEMVCFQNPRPSLPKLNGITSKRQRHHFHGHFQNSTASPPKLNAITSQTQRHHFQSRCKTDQKHPVLMHNFMVPNSCPAITPTATTLELYGAKFMSGLYTNSNNPRSL